MRRGRVWLVAVAAVVATAVAWGIVRSRGASRSPADGRGGATGGGAAGAGAGGPGARVIPVTIAAAARRDVPIYLEGLGNVAAFRTVTVRTQVDGRLDAVLFQEGQLVRRGQVLARIDPRPFQAQLHQAEGALARDEAQLENVRLNVERDRELVAQKLVPQQQLDADVAAAGQLEGAVRMDHAALETARLNLDYARIVSPIDGVTGLRPIDAGNVVHPGDPGGIVVVTQLDPIAVVFTQPQDQLPAIAEQLARGKLAVDAFSRDGSTLLGSGELVAVDNQINATTATVRLKAILPNPRRVLWPNQFVNARLRLELRRGALVVPATALQRGPSGTFVYVAAADDTVASRPVSIDRVQGDVAIVASGLAEGDRVVVDGQNQLRPGAKVAPRPQGRPEGGGAATPGAPAPGQAGTAGPPRGDGPPRQGQPPSRAQGRGGGPPVASDGGAPPGSTGQ
jgi:multidrug efflux system membrane fusion protein